MTDHEKIKKKVKLKLPLTKEERAIYLLLIATIEEVKDYLANE